MSVSECGTGFLLRLSSRNVVEDLSYPMLANVCRIGSGVCYHRPTWGMVLRTARCESHKLKRLSLEDARKCGLKPCKQCGPD